MRVVRRLVTALGATAVILVLVGCGGLGINIGSGTSRSSNLVNVVSIQVQSGPNVYTVLRGHVLLLNAIAYYFFGGTQYVSATQGAVWSTPNTCIDTSASAGPRIAGPCGIIRFMNDPLCSTVINNTDQSGANWITPITEQTACIFGANAGSATLNATVAGVTGHVTVTVVQ